MRSGMPGLRHIGWRKRISNASLIAPCSWQRCCCCRSQFERSESAGGPSSGFARTGGHGFIWLPVSCSRRVCYGFWGFSSGFPGFTSRATPSLTLPALAGFLLTAAVVAFAEEAFFRGALFGLAARTAPPAVAMLFVSALFAVLHFLKPPEHALGTSAVQWWSGLAFLPKTFWQWGNPGLVLGGFTTLFVVALVLGYARLRTGALFLPMGLHAGWIFGLKSYGKISRHATKATLWVGGDLLHGLAPVLIVVLTGGIVWMWLEQEERLDPETDR